MAVNTKIFNIRINKEKHKKFKKYAEDNDISMGAILNRYIDSLLDGTAHQVAAPKGQEHRRTQKYEDPLDAIRDQYQQGEDF